MGIPACVIDVDRTLKFRSGSYSPRQTCHLYRPAEGSPGIAGRRALKQGNRISSRHWGAYSESPCGQADGESRRAESYRAHGTRPYTLASYRKVEVEHSRYTLHFFAAGGTHALLLILVED